MDRGAVDAFYSGLNSSLIDLRGHLSNVVLLSSWNARRHLAKINGKEAVVGNEWGVDKLLAVKDMADLETDLFPTFLLKHPLLDSRAPAYGNLAGIGWLILQREMADNGTSTRENLDHLLRVYERIVGGDGEKEEELLLPGFESMTGRQMALVWLTRVWGCGASRANPEFETAEQTGRRALFQSIQGQVEKEFSCGSNE